MSSSTSTSAHANRRNGTAPSCEPCRKRKIRCDHQRPVCGRCHRRGLSVQCFYHPAPLTRRRNSSSTPISEDRRLGQEGDVRGSEVPLNHASERSGGSNRDQQSVQKLTDASNARGLLQHRTDESRLQTALAFLTLLRHMSFIDKLLRRYYTGSSSALVPAAFVLPMSSDLLSRWNQSPDRDALCRNIADVMLASTAKVITLTPQDGPAELCRAMHGDNFRLEILGLIYTIAARSCMYGLVNDEIIDRDSFQEELLQCSNGILRLTRDIIPEASDALVWLQYENLLLTNSLHGNAGRSSFGIDFVSFFFMC